MKSFDQSEKEFGSYSGRELGDGLAYRMRVHGLI